MKKLVALSLSASMMLAAAVPAFATFHGDDVPHFVSMNQTTVAGNDVSSNANTGYNTQEAGVSTSGNSGWWGGSTSVVGGGVHQELITGNALSVAGSTISVDQSGCGCFSLFKSNEADVVDNTVYSGANSGFNSQGAEVSTVGTSGGARWHDERLVGGSTSVVGGGIVQLMQTGNAGSQGWSVVNINQ